MPVEALSTNPSQVAEMPYTTKVVKGNDPMSATHVFYKVEIDTFESPEHPIIYFRKCKRCSTAKGADRQHNRMVNEAVEAWRPFSQKISRYTISRVPADVVVHGDIR